MWARRGDRERAGGSTPGVVHSPALRSNAAEDYSNAVRTTPKAVQGKLLNQST